MSGAPQSFRAVVAALVANILITAAKFLAWGLSGSGAMLSEAIHSTADAGNQFLLFLGMTRASREQDSEFHYGFGPERFVFGLLSAAGIFFIGCGVTTYHGIHGMLQPSHPEFGITTVVVLAVSFILEGYSMSVAVRTVMRMRGDRSFFSYLFGGADPAAVAIVLEDAAALLGLLLAAVGILLAWLTGNPIWDALGSTLIGLLLGFIAVFLALENRELLLGKAAPRAVEDRFREVLLSTAGIREVHDLKSRQITPEAFKLKAEIKLDPAHMAAKLGEVLPSTEAPGREGLLRALAERAVLTISDIIDDAEDRAVKAIPEARHIDLEVDHTDESLAQKASKGAS